MPVRSFAPGKEILQPRGQWSVLAEKRKGNPSRASLVQNCRFAPGVVRTRAGTTVVAPATGLVTGLYNWITPSADNYVLYRDGVALRSLKQPSTFQSILNDVGTMLRPSFSDLNKFLYLCGYDVNGKGTSQCRVYDGTNSDTAFRGPLTFLAAAALDGGDGLCSQGTHNIGFVYQNRSGFAGKPTTTFGSAPITVTLDADNRLVNISVELPPLDDGGGNATLFLLATTSDNLFKYYWMDDDAQTGQIGQQPVPLSTATTLNFVMNLSDSDMEADLDDATDQFDLLTVGTDGTGPFLPSFVVAYGNRMCYGVDDTLYVSDQEEPQQVSLVRNVLKAPNRRLIRYAFPLPGSVDLYTTGDGWTARHTDNNDIPNTWGTPISISEALGAKYPSHVCFRTGGNHAWIVTEAGPYLFTGTYSDRPLTYLVSDFWKRVNWNAAYAIETADDVVNQIFYMSAPLDGATQATHLFVFDYTNGKGYDEVDISIDKFQRPIFGSVGVVREYSTGLTGPWIGPVAGVPQSYTFTVQVTDANGDTDSVQCSIDVSCPG